jgi:hypothetical protein
MSQKAFVNQRPRYQNLSPPYAEKSLDNPRGYFPSRKNSRQIAFWNMREYNFIVLAESSAAILAYEERPDLLQMRAGPAWYRYVPHFRVDLQSGPVYVELSHRGKPSTHRQQVVATLARAQFRADRKRFVELSHADVRSKPRLSNASLLTRYLSMEVSDEQALHARDVLARGPAPMREVEAASGVSHGRLLHMALGGGLALNTRDAITRETLISLSNAGGSR